MRHTLTLSAKVLSTLLLFACLTTAGKANPFSGMDTKKGLSAVSDAVKAVTVSDADLQAATKQMMDQMDAKNRIAPENSEYGKRLVNLTKNHANEEGMKLNFKVYLVQDINAFATPDGSVRVFAGLMDKMTDDELRSIIGHEIGHVKLEHSLKRARTAYLGSAAAKVASAQSGLGAQELADLTEKFINAQYSQSNEFEADAYGVKFLKRHNYNLPAAESALRKLLEIAGSGKGGGVNNLFSSHPDTKQRADKVHDLITK